MNIRTFPSREQLSAELAESLAQCVMHAVERTGAATLVVPGGSTPALLLPAFAAMDLPWSCVTLLLSDERRVAVDDARRNESATRRTFAEPLRQGARLQSFDAWTQAGNDDVPVSMLAGLQLPFAAVLLGMGEDGHFASLFPGSQALARGLDPDSGLGLVHVPDAPDGVPRDSLCLPVLVNSARLYLLTTGQSKLDVLREVRAGNAAHLPIASLAGWMRRDDHVYWAA